MEIDKRDPIKDIDEIVILLGKQVEATVATGELVKRMAKVDADIVNLLSWILPVIVIFTFHLEIILLINAIWQKYLELSENWQIALFGFLGAVVIAVVTAYITWRLTKSEVNRDM